MHTPHLRRWEGGAHIADRKNLKAVRNSTGAANHEALTRRRPFIPQGKPAVRSVAIANFEFGLAVSELSKGAQAGVPVPLFSASYAWFPQLTGLL